MVHRPTSEESLHSAPTAIIFQHLQIQLKHPRIKQTLQLHAAPCPGEKAAYEASKAR